MSKRYKHVYAIVRVDNWPEIKLKPTNAITVKKIVATMEVAISEVERLNNLAENRDSIYFWQTTRIEE